MCNDIKWWIIVRGKGWELGLTKAILGDDGNSVKLDCDNKTSLYM